MIMAEETVQVRAEAVRANLSTLKESIEEASKAKDYNSVALLSKAITEATESLYKVEQFEGITDEMKKSIRKLDKKIKDMPDLGELD